MLKKILSLCAALALSACQERGPGGPPLELSFAHYQPIHLDVGSIEFIESYQPPMVPPNVEHLMPYSPTEALRIWVRERLHAVGDDRSLQVIVKDAHVTFTRLPTPGGVKGLLTISQDRRYDARIEAELRIYGSRAMSEASINVNATRSVTMAENASVNMRDAAFRRLARELMENLNAELEKNIYMYFSQYISYSQTP